MSHPALAWSPPLPEAPGFDHRVVETPGLHTHLAETGDGEAVLLLHGFPQHWWQWRTVAPIIAAQGYRVLCPDLRGAGWTTADDPRMSRETRLHDLLALLDELDVERVHLVSHDMGAITAMQLTYDHPERVRTAVQLSVWPGFLTFSPRLAPAFQHLPGLIWHRPGSSLRGTFSERYVARPMAETTVEAHLAPLSRPEIDGAVRPLCRRMILPEALRMMRGAYRRRRLAVPTLVVFGRRDHPTTEELMARICPEPERYADRVEFAYVDDAAHFITDDAPTAVAHLATDWFARAA
ncbi:pimeloyl-ACP methyl ester carboxylesterase [Isoptericola sp. CG 20/1183]|uniref:Pimeloyl-ACP methyl ester carboxylesterase n=1 Tax=Isoptericola halotolerans TaxID=300560 RepID=A0ABX5EH65_9MICO|nr:MULTISPECIES: alpha/beta hydrolase [Isoptericola]PRZ08767.1 pimeloyl-ACP methyl ester carboxylesterase [Isoptericola halotolerans]PRZ10786.1 pimeloyl-ACP methyl ester carboxylesterase [Isoptericola sp. CG 20/1183]